MIKIQLHQKAITLGTLDFNCLTSKYADLQIVAI